MSKLEAVCSGMTIRHSCHDALRRRGSLLIWRDKDMTWRADRAGRP
ncbi:MAG: IS5/IS1182 family transposase, partial [Alphaproteobacteria bacterium]|nr:IS5/IS1182 family transposase [Alphaproteobacteria bacterium]